VSENVKVKWQYSLKTYFLMILIVGLAIGWWCDHQRLQTQLNDARRRIQDLETAPYFDVMPQIQMQPRR